MVAWAGRRVGEGVEVRVDVGLIVEVGRLVGTLVGPVGEVCVGVKAIIVAVRFSTSADIYLMADTVALMI